MNKWMMSAAGLLVLTTAVHVFLGGPEIHWVIQDSTLPPDVRAVAAVIWHAITVILFAFALGCAWLVRHENKPMAYLMSGIQIGFAALFVFYGLSLLGNLTIMPQWIIFLLVPALTLRGTRQTARTGTAAA